MSFYLNSFNPVVNPIFTGGKQAIFLTLQSVYVLIYKIGYKVIIKHSVVMNYANIERSVT